MATHSGVLAWRIPGIGEPGGLPSVGSHRVRHDRSDLAAIASKVILKILQARLQQYVNHELPDVQMVLEKAKEPGMFNCQQPLDHQKGKRIPEKHLYLL